MAFLSSHSQLATAPAAPEPGTHRGPGSMRSAATYAVAALGVIGVCGIAAWQLGTIGNASNPTTTLAAGVPMSLTQRVLAPSEFSGMIVTPQPTVLRSASAWATNVEQSSSPARETARLQALGYVGGVDEQLHGRYPMTAAGVSVVEQFRSAAGAQAELAYRYKRLRNSHGVRVGTFPVAIPGAQGVSVTGGGTVGRNVMFAEGPYYYLVGVGAPSHARHLLSGPQLASAAGFLYLSLNGCVAQPGQSRAS
jgi:hypothetical protein